MRPYLDTARSYLWVIVVVLALTWGSGIALAYLEYTSSFQADATVWTQRGLLRLEDDGRLVVSPELAPQQDPAFATLMTPAAEQAGSLGQLLQTRSFLREIASRTSLPIPASPSEERKFLDDMSKRFKVEVLGMNLFRLSYRARDPRTGPAVVLAVLALRREQSVEARRAATEAATNSYRSELALAQSQALAARTELEAFDGAHRPPLGALDEYEQRQLRVAVEDARTRIADLKARIDRSAVMAGIVETADSLDFQVVDEPIEDARPSGGSKPAAMIAGSAIIGGLALASVLVMGCTLLASRVGAEADIARLAPATLFATIPKVALRKGVTGSELRSALAAAAFAPPAEHARGDG
jgi:uncharacterized protein involved in exopolysaccharide biosynthesis